jgi:hypothetical protein
LRKQEIYKLIVDEQSFRITELESYREKLEGVTDLDENSSRDIDDFSHQNESMELVLRTKYQVEQARETLDLLSIYAETEHSSVLPGALVETDLRWFLIGANLSSFDIEGREIIGISNDSPIYSVMVDKVAGDNFQFADKKYTILNIY